MTLPLLVFGLLYRVRAHQEAGHSGWSWPIYVLLCLSHCTPALVPTLRWATGLSVLNRE